MIQQFRHRQFPASNPLANALVIIVGVLVIAMSLLLGVVAFVALLAAAVVMGVVIGLRVWWLNRRLRGNRKLHVHESHAPRATAKIIEGEFHEITPDKERESGGEP